MHTNFTILFFLRKKKADHNEGYIFIRLTVNGQRTEFSSGRKCESSAWDQRAGKLKGHNNDVKQFNMYLKTIESNLFEVHRQLLQAGISISAENIRNKYLGKGERVHQILEIFADHNKRMQSLIGTEFSQGTWVKYETTFKHTQNFIKWKYGKSDFLLKEINHAFIADFDYYLRSVGKCANNTAFKYLRNFNKIVRIGIKNGWIDRSPFANFSTKLKEVHRVYLTEEELDILENKKFGSDRLSLVRDMFMFSCYTGLAYIDLAELQKSNINLVMSGEKWIVTKRRKTDIACSIPLLPQAERIIQQYASHPLCIDEKRILPVISNQKTNAYLKEIATVCGINKELTFHIARHTFATTVTLTNGVSIESVSKMLGHKNLRTTQHYAKIIDQKVGEDMRVLRAKMMHKADENRNKSA